MAAKAFLAGAVLILLFAASADADWSVASGESQKGSAAGVEHRRVVLSDAGSGDEATIELAFFSPKSAIVRVTDNPEGDDLASVIRRVRGVAGVNGGYFDPKNAPVGLVISDGKLIAPFRKARLLSGVLIASKGRFELLRAAEYSSRKTATTALQCGPFLVDGGTAVPGLNNTRPARRTFVLTSGSGRAAIGYSSSVTLAEMGEILATPGLAPELKVQRALNLDGGSSSAFWFSGERGVVSKPEYKTVRNFVIVSPK